MNLPLFIARRYFFSRQKRSFISWLSILSMLGVGVGTMALVVVLSVFNGMDALNRQIFKTFEADLSIRPRTGKRIDLRPALLADLARLPGVASLTRVIEDNALARYADAQTVVKVKGVDDNYLARPKLDSALVEGQMSLHRNGIDATVVAVGIRNQLSIRPEDPFTALELLYPQQQPGRNTLNLLSTEAFRQQNLAVAGSFFIESRYDDFVLAPLSVIRDLFGYGPNQLTSAELQLRPGTDEIAVQRAVQQQLNQAGLANRYRVLTRDELNPDLFRAIRVEKLFVALTLAFIILVASVNILFSLSMLVIEKTADIRILKAMGASAGTVRAIFLTEGTIIALSGAVTGLLFGIGFVGVQDRFGLIKLGMASSLVDAYPVRLLFSDLAWTAGLIVLLTVLTAWLPAQRAARISTVS
jgi:lipoprotein-releasing system permease protein